MPDRLMIETATRDGSEVLVLEPATEGDGEHWHVARFNAEFGDWIVADCVAIRDPIAWSPLP